MQCKIHPETTGVNTCNACGCWLCEECTFERVGRLFCPHCAAQQSADYLGGTGESPGRSAAKSAPGGRPTMKSHVNWGMLFLFSVLIPLPGLNYMYMGLIKRGVMAMSAFFILFYVGISLSGSNLWMLAVPFFLALPVLWFVVLFDGFLTRRRINAGEPVYDNIDGIIAIIKRHRKFIAVVLLLVAGLNVVTEIMPQMWRFTALLGRLVPIGVVGVALYFLLRKK